MEEMTPETFSGMCRTCLSTAECMRDIFKEKASNNSSLVNVLMECSSLQVSSTDGLPSVICKSCVSYLETFIRFKIRCAESKKILEGYRDNIADRFVFKEEPVDVEDNFLETHIKVEADSIEKKFDDDTADSNDFPIANLELPLYETNVEDSPHEVAFVKIPIPCLNRPVDVEDNFPETHVKIEADSIEEKFDDDIADFPIANLELPLYDTKVEDSPHKVASIKIPIPRLNLPLVEKKSELKRTLTMRRRIHTGDRSFVCNVCNKSFTSKYKFKLHTRIHVGEKPFKCTICDKSFSFKYRYDAHTRQHSSDSCEYEACGKSLRIKCKSFYWRSHSTEKPFKCNLCTLSFFFRSNLVAHHRTHTGERPYQCDVCDKSFTNTHNLKRHLRTHTGERPYRCDRCDKSFSVKQNLERHLRIHTGERPYKCHVCQKSFTQNNNLKQHMVVHSSTKTT